MTNKPFWNGALTLNKGTVFAIKIAVAHWFDGDTTREEAVESAANAIAKHMRSTGQVGDLEGWRPVDIADALFANNYTNGDEPFWFDEGVELAEEIGERTLEILAEPLPLAA